MTDRPEIFVQEAHRRYQLGSAYRRVEELSEASRREFHEKYGVDPQNTATMKLALHSLMIGSHAHRMPLEDEL